MNSDRSKTSSRKKEHIELCMTDKVAFKNKTTGFENYEFKHYAITEVEIDKIKLETKFFGKKISYPFLISCMTGGTGEAENINAKLALVAEELNIPIGVGSQRQALENKDFLESFRVVRKNAQSVPVLSNIGAAEIVKFKNTDPIQKIIDMIEADILVIHLNPLQELLQKEGNPDFKGLLKKIKFITGKINIPVIAKEVGSGISKEAAKKLLDSGVKGIDVAGAGGTSWAGVEILRNKGNSKNMFWDWGLPTSYCVKEISKLKQTYKFKLIASGGITNGIEIAKALALGADITASARKVLQQIENSGVDRTISFIKNLFEEVKKIMFLTGSKSVKDLQKGKLIKKDNFI